MFFSYWFKIPKTIVDKQNELPFPACQIDIKWNGEARDTFPDVFRRVDLHGAKHPNNYFNVILPEQDVRPLQDALHVCLPAQAPSPAAQGQTRTVL